MARVCGLKAAWVIRPASASRAMNSSISSAFFARALAASSRWAGTRSGYSSRKDRMHDGSRPISGVFAVMTSLQQLHVADRELLRVAHETLGKMRAAAGSTCPRDDHLVAEPVEELHGLDAHRRVVVVRELIAEEEDATVREGRWNLRSAQVFGGCVS
jgi:hypothetical protein